MEEHLSNVGRLGEACHEDCIEPTLKHGRGSVMVWGCMSESGAGELKLVNCRLNVKGCVNLLRTALPSSVQSLGLYRQ